MKVLPERLEVIYEEILSLLAQQRFSEIKERLSSLEPADVSEILSEVPTPKRALLFRLLPKDLAIEVFEHMEGSERE